MSSLIITAADDNDRINLGLVLSGAITYPELAAVLSETKSKVNATKPMILSAGFTPTFEGGKPAAWVTLVTERAHAPSLLSFLMVKLRRSFPDACLRAHSVKKAVSIRNLAAVNAVIQAVLRSRSWPGLDEVHAAAEPTGSRNKQFNFYFWWDESTSQSALHTYLEKCLSGLASMVRIRWDSGLVRRRIGVCYRTGDVKKSLAVLIQKLPKQTWFAGFCNDADADDSVINADDRAGILEMCRSILTDYVIEAAAEPVTSQDFNVEFDTRVPPQHTRHWEKLLDHECRSCQINGDELGFGSETRLTITGQKAAVLGSLVRILSEIKNLGGAAVRLPNSTRWISQSEFDVADFARQVVRWNED